MAYIWNLPFAEPVSDEDLELYAENGLGDLRFEDEHSAPETYDVVGPYDQLVGWMISYYQSGSAAEMAEHIANIKLEEFDSL